MTVRKPLVLVDGVPRQLPDGDELLGASEWTAETVSQAEAEAGTATTRRAWTAQRVRQAIDVVTTPMQAAIGAKQDVLVSGTNIKTINNESLLGSGNITITDADTATRLQTARTINGTSFDGSANITTANWGTARTITIGNTGKQFDGSANVSWSLAEIGVTAFGLGGSAWGAGSPNDYLLGSFTAAGFTESDAVSLGFPALGGDQSIPRHWNVITFGVADRRTQIATEVFGIYTTRGRTFVRVKHDDTWYPWVELYSTGNLRDAVEVISTNTTAVASRTYVLTASLTLTLPATPTVGDWVNIVNRSGTTTPIVARNGQNIMGLAEDMRLDNANATLRLVFVGGTIGWVLN